VCRGEDGSPPASVTWFKDGVQIGGTGIESKTLTFRNVERTVSGTYKCVAQSHTLFTDEESVINHLGNSSKIFNLAVAGNIHNLPLINVSINTNKTNRTCIMNTRNYV
jgi:hypothetical protein